MSEQDKAKKSTEDLTGQVKEKVSDLRDQVQVSGRTVHVLRTNAVQLVTCVAVVGILINNRRSFKFTQRVVKNMDKNMLETQNIIVSLKEAGKTFEYYPGIGVYVTN